ncbi:DUF262 domain-containing protein [Candidatus Thiothrix anitrata]|uniref:DUF262 domain-containing protein n=1 Tax=Candidatus Thiothrix anitrata TaxID=2823902 RepID=A0ABX7X2S2_9GAMM|nr:DUF262 domain-containing protein [Candidatus Thiothrix anitrata]QTR49577.1 DUF262 domain-containing protein [Candidatus Thiothrix anitrata]
MSEVDQKVDARIEPETDSAGLEKETDASDLPAPEQPFDPAKIDIVTQPRSIPVLLSRLKHGEMDLSPDFQRHANLWGDDRKTSLIESILLKIPIPSLYVSEDKDGNYAVVDGLQRMSAIAHFVDVDALNDALGTTLKPLALNAKGLRSFQDLKGKTFNELERPLQRRILETELMVHVIRSGTPGAVKFNIFSRINEGGLPLTAQEIRNAIYPGRWRDEIRKLVESDEFKQATEGKIQAKRMEDMELMLRAVAIHHQREPRPNDQNLEDYLNAFVEKECQHWDDAKWKIVQVHIRAALFIAPIVFDEYVFRKYYRENEKRKPINRGLFEAQVGILSRYDINQLNILISKKNEILNEFSDLFPFSSLNKPLITSDDFMSFSFDLSNDELDAAIASIEDDNGGESSHYLLIKLSFRKAITFVTSKGWASNKRVEAMQYIFDQALRDDKETNNA